MTKAQLIEKRNLLRKSLESVIALGDEATLEQVTQAEAHTSELEEVEASLQRFEKIAAAKALLTPQVDRPDFLSYDRKENSDSLPAEVLRVKTRNFATDGQFDANEKAFRFGKFVKGFVLGSSADREYCLKNGILTKAQVENDNSLGGYLVPEEFGTDYIRLVEKYGIARQLLDVEPMARDTKTCPRRRTGLTAYFVNEAASITASDMTVDQITLVAKKLAVLNQQSNELFSDNIISMADKVIEEIAQSMAAKEDDCAFNGDGTSTYGGITGIRQKLKDVDGTIANIKGLQVGSGNLYSELVVADFTSTIGRLPEYASMNPVWCVSRKFYYDVMVKLAQTSGGLTPGQLMQGEAVKSMTFLGYPVVIAQKMPTTEGNSQVCALFGDFKMGAKFGYRTDLSLAVSNELGFQTDTRYIRGIQRFDINVHDVGDTTDAGPIVGLITAAS